MIVRTVSFLLSLRVPLVLLRPMILPLPLYCDSTCHCDLVCVRVRVRVRVHVLLCSTVSIDPSLNRVVPDLFVSLNVPFRSYFQLALLVLLRPTTSTSTPTDDTPTPSSDRGIDT